MVDDRQLAELRREADRYREVAEVVLDQLDWCVGYFHRMRKPGIADGIARNCKVIRRELLR